MFRRRDRRPLKRILREAVWPRGGWMRAAEYVKHRVRRLPDPPERIARGIWAGVFAAFTPFYGLHFVVAGLIAWVMRGNLIAAFLSTFFGNPLTYVPIIAISLNTGYFILGIRPKEDFEAGVLRRFAQVTRQLWDNLGAAFGPRDAEWGEVVAFWHEIFYPFLIGGIVPGVVVATGAYYLSVPVIRAYQNRWKGRLAAKLKALRAKAPRKGNAKAKTDHEEPTR
ncbi:MAG: DUF2062 domain-containing protein [Shimia sp.]